MLSALFKWLVNASAELSIGLRRQLTLRGTATPSVAVTPHSHAEPLLYPVVSGPRNKSTLSAHPGQISGTAEGRPAPCMVEKREWIIGFVAWWPMSDLL